MKAPKNTTYKKDLGDGVTQTIKVIEYKHWFVASVITSYPNGLNTSSNKKFFRTKKTPTDKLILNDIFKWYGISEKNKE